MDNSIDKAICYISKIVFNNGEGVSINPDDIVVFVGPNNAGKSQSLKDIYALAQSLTDSVVVKQIECQYDIDKLRDYIAGHSITERSGTHIHYYGYAYDIYDGVINDSIMKKGLGTVRDFTIAYLDTSNRLSICTPPHVISRDEIPQHPIQVAAFNPANRKWLSDNFKKAFEEELIPNTFNVATIPLCIGEMPKIKYDSENTDIGELVDDLSGLLKEYKQVHKQGDGVKSFTGILLYLMIERYATFIIDEPESFLHPPQARIMGEIIGESLNSTQQAFISTHSEEIVKGLLAKCNSRLKVIRITRNRDSDINEIRILDNDDLKSLWGDPILSHSNIISALFHRKAILCESDSDCKMYSLIEEALCAEENKYSETLYVHCGGKQRMAVVAKALKAVGVDIRLIADMDVLNDEAVIKELINSLHGEWASFKNDYNILSSQLHSPKDHINREEARSEIEKIINKNNATDLTDEEIKRIEAIVKKMSKWQPLKDFGFSGAPKGDASIALCRLDIQFKQLGLYMVPVGELENFVKVVGGHGPKWVNKVIETYSDFHNTVYSEIKEFIKEVVDL